MLRKFNLYRSFFILLFLTIISFTALAQQHYDLNAGWMLIDSAKVHQQGKEISVASFNTSNWYKATVPGTVLTSLINDNIYPEPLYGENNRPDKISDSLCRTSYWYRTVFIVPKNYQGKQIILNFDGINYAAQVWVNGNNVGEIKGAFARGIFDITKYVQSGKCAVLAVLISPQPHPGVPHEHTLKMEWGAMVESQQLMALHFFVRLAGIGFLLFVIEIREYGKRFFFLLQDLFK